MFGIVAISAINAATRMMPMYEGVQPRFNVLKLRKRMVLTISAAGINTTATDAIAWGKPTSGYGQAKTVAAGWWNEVCVAP